MSNKGFISCDRRRGYNKLVKNKRGKKYRYEEITLPPSDTNAHVIEARSLIDECNDINEKYAPGSKQTMRRWR